MPTRATRSSKRKRELDEEESAVADDVVQHDEDDDEEDDEEYRTRKNRKRARRSGRGPNKVKPESPQQQPAADHARGPSSADKGKARSDGWGSSPTVTAEDAAPLDLASTSTLGPTTTTNSSSSTSAPDTVNVDELTRLKTELAQKEALLKSHQAFAKQILQLTSCHICMELVDDPLTLACGHSFCRNCLWECFTRPVPEDAPLAAAEEEEQYATADEGGDRPEPSAPSRPHETGDENEDDNGTRTETETAPPAAADIVEDAIRLNAQRRQNLYCPSCRARVHEPPFPVWGLRDLVQTVSDALTTPGGVLHDPSSSAALTQEAERSSRPAPASGSADWNGLFVQPERRRNTGFRDEEDRVLRCRHCNWELRDGFCEQCGAEYSEDEDDDDFGGVSRRNRIITDSASVSDGDSLDEEEEEDDYAEMDDFLVHDDDDEAMDPQIASMLNMARRHGPRRGPVAPLSDDEEEAEREWEGVDEEEEEEEEGREAMGEEEDEQEGEEADEDEGSDDVHESEGEGELSEDDSFVRRSLVAGSDAPGRRATVFESGTDEDDDEEGESEPVRASSYFSGRSSPPPPPPPITTHDAEATTDEERQSDTESDDAAADAPAPVVARRRAPRVVESDSDRSSPMRQASTNRRGGRLTAEISGEGLDELERMPASHVNMLRMFRDRARGMAGAHREEGSEGDEDEEDSGRFEEVLDEAEDSEEEV